MRMCPAAWRWRAADPVAASCHQKTEGEVDWSSTATHANLWVLAST
jgi:hypothetical protein